VEGSLGISWRHVLRPHFQIHESSATSEDDYVVVGLECSMAWRGVARRGVAFGLLQDLGIQDPFRRSERG
jgi:hypothetical protein